VCECVGQVCYEFRNYNGMDYNERHRQPGWGPRQWARTKHCQDPMPKAFGADFTMGSQHTGSD
jgi:hypothetical protein